MTHGRKPRRVRWSPWVNTLATVTSRVALVDKDDQASVTQPIDQAFTAMRQAVGSEQDWAYLCSAINVAQAIEKQGVVKGLCGHFHLAELALEAIKKRAADQPSHQGQWHPVELYIDEIDAIKDGITLHKFQLKNLSTGEVIKALNYAQAEIRSSGGKVIDAREPVMSVSRLGVRSDDRQRIQALLS